MTEDCLGARQNFFGAFPCVTCLHCDTLGFTYNALTYLPNFVISGAI